MSVSSVDAVNPPTISVAPVMFGVCATLNSRMAKSGVPQINKNHIESIPARRCSRLCRAVEKTADRALMRY